MSNFIQSPKNRLNSITEKANSREKNFNTIGRDRANSAFQKFDTSKNEQSLKEESVSKSPLIKGNQGEPSFGAASKQETISNAKTSQNRLSGTHESVEKTQNKN